MCSCRGYTMIRVRGLCKKDDPYKANEEKNIISVLKKKLKTLEDHSNYELMDFRASLCYKIRDLH